MCKNNENTVETLFINFLGDNPTGELAKAVRAISATIDEQIANGCVDHDTISDYECAAMREGFYAGFFAALSLENARLALG